MLEGLRPLLVPSRLEDVAEKVGFRDDHWVMSPGGGGIAEVTDEVIYLAMSLRNVGRGIAVLDRWAVHPVRMIAPDHGDPETYQRLSRDLYVPPNDRGFWQGALRDRSDELFGKVRAAIEARTPLTVELMYSDYTGGQRMISRFAFMPASSGGWLLSGGRNWNLDRPEPR